MVSLARFLPAKLAKMAWLDKPVLQEHFFRKSLREVVIRYGQIKIDHYKGMCWHKKTGWVPLCFPVKIITTIEKLSKKKTINYFFKGAIPTPENGLKDILILMAHCEAET